MIHRYTSSTALGFLLMWVSPGVVTADPGRLIHMPAYFEPVPTEASDALFRCRLPAGDILIDRDGAEMPRYNIKIRFDGAHRTAVSGVGQAPFHLNYFLGHDPGQWKQHVPAWARIRQTSIYPGINVDYHLADDESGLEYDFVVAPGADPARIRLHYAGAQSMTTGLDGDLLLFTQGGTLRQHRPEAYQYIDGQQIPVSVSYRLRPAGRVSLVLGPYDRTRSLTIDPVVVYATYLGGQLSDSVYAIAADSEGNAYVTGFTSSPGFPVSANAAQPSCGSDRFCDATPADIYPPSLPSETVSYGDAFVAKIGPDGSTLVWATFLGGSSGEIGGSIAVDGQGNVYVGGLTSSADFPVTSGLFGSRLMPAAFFTKLNSSGERLVFSMLVPLLQNAHVGGDASGQGYLAGTASGPLPTTTGAAQTAISGSQAVYLARVSADGGSLLFGTYLGGGVTTLGGLQVAPDGSVGIAGTTTGSNLPVTAGAVQTRLAGRQNAFVARFDTSGHLSACSYLGGSVSEQVAGVSIDSADNIYVAGTSNSPDFPIAGGLDMPSVLGSPPGFAAKVSPDGTALVYSTLLSLPAKIATGNSDGTLAVLIAGEAPYLGSNILEIDSSGASLVANLFLPVGSPASSSASLALDAAGNLYAADRESEFCTGDSDCPFQSTPGAFQTSPAGRVNATIMKVAPHGGSLLVSPSPLFVNLRVGSWGTQTINLTTAGGPFGAPVKVSYHTDVPWLTPVSGWGIVAWPESPGSFPVTVTTTSQSGPPLTVGRYTGNLIVESPGMENSPVTVPVILTVDDLYTYYPYVSPSTVSCKYTLGTDPYDSSLGNALSVALSFNGGPLLSATALSSGWLTYDSTNGGVKCNPANLAPGLYQGEVDAVVGPSPGTALKAAVYFNVIGPWVYAIPGSVELLQFAGMGSAEASVALGEGRYSVHLLDPPALPTVTSITSDASWVTVTPSSQTLPMTLSITANTAGLPPGSYHSAIRVQTTGSVNPTLTVPVSVTIDPAVPISISPASISYAIPSPDMLTGDRTIFIDSPVPTPFQAQGGDHSSVTPTSGTTPATLHVSVKYFTSGDAIYQDYVTITTPGPGGITRMVPISIVAVPYLASYSAAGITNAATFLSGPVAPGSLVSVFGNYLSPLATQAQSVPIPLYLAGVSVDITGGMAPILYVGPRQVNIQIPWEAKPGQGALSLQGVPSIGGTYAPFVLAESSPGIFTWGQNQAAALNTDQSLNQPGNGAKPGSVVSVFCTGQGAVDHPIADGAATPTNVLIRITLPVEATIGGQPADVLFAGMAPTLVGVCQVNLLVPDLPPGNYPVQIQVGTVKSNAPMLSVGN